MQPTALTGQLLDLAEACGNAHTSAEVRARTLAPLRAVAGATSALMVSPGPAGSLPVARDGESLPMPVGEELTEPSRSRVLETVVTPETWRDRVTEVAAWRLPGHAGTVFLAWGTETRPESDELRLALLALDGAVARVQAAEDLADLAARTDNAQQLANMGDYDWHIPSDTNVWSDQLFRIYGHEPGSFNPSYERFLSLIHPDDRERITGVHQQAYATGEPYAMIERIVRPGGEVRYLSSNGEVIMDADSQPVRMRGTCIDITDRVHTEHERELVAARFRGLVDSAPDAILILDDEQVVIDCNHRAHELLGGEPNGVAVRDLLPSWNGTGGRGLPARRLDGLTLQVDVITATVDLPDGEASERLVGVFVRDSAIRLEGERLAASESEARLRRRQALEINDNVVQGLVAAVYSLDAGEAEISAKYLDQTLDAARAMMDDLLEPLGDEELGAGDLVRATPTVIGARADAAEVTSRSRPEGRSVLVVDDAEDLRMLLRARIESRPGLRVVGEAADGQAAVDLATELQPDLVLLDLAMPKMDGLEALPLIRAAVPGVRVVVLSGFNQSTLSDQALEAGADRYVVKGGSMRSLLDLVEELLDEQS